MHKFCKCFYWSPPFWKYKRRKWYKVRRWKLSVTPSRRNLSRFAWRMMKQCFPWPWPASSSSLNCWASSRVFGPHPQGGAGWPVPPPETETEPKLSHILTIVINSIWPMIVSHWNTRSDHLNFCEGKNIFLLKSLPLIFQAKIQYNFVRDFRGTIVAKLNSNFKYNLSWD